MHMHMHMQVGPMLSYCCLDSRVLEGRGRTGQWIQMNGWKERLQHLCVVFLGNIEERVSTL